MIGPFFDGGVVLDLYGGSGGLAIEAISRGMEKAYIVEKNFKAIQIIKENIQSLKAEKSFEVMKSDADKALQSFASKNIQFDLVLLDPPYALQKMAEQIEVMEELDLLTEDAVIVCEMDKSFELPEEIGAFHKTRRNVAGITAIEIYKRGADDE
jgi:16S rRNA (guanine(966)-N(2))-methyltransferase RsmD